MKTIFKLSFNIGAALMLGVVISSFTGFAPTAVAGTVMVAGFAANMVNKNAVAFLSIQADIFNPTQLQFKDIIMSSIYLHFGYRQMENGEWKPGPDARPLPAFLMRDKVEIKRFDFDQVKYLTPTENTFEFLNTPLVQGKEFESNIFEATLIDKIHVSFGIQAELATGASAADTMEILDFGAAGSTEGELLNARVNYEINNGKKILENQSFRSLFINDDAIKNYFRFPGVVIIEPRESRKLTLKLSKAYPALTHKYVRITSVGYLLQ